LFSVTKEHRLGNYCLWLTIKSKAVAIRANGSGFPHDGITALTDFVVVGQCGDFRGCLRAVLGGVFHDHIKEAAPEDRPAFISEEIP